MKLSINWETSIVYLASKRCLPCRVSSEVMIKIGHFSTFVRKITLIIDISSIPLLWITTRILFHHPAHPGTIGRRGRYTRAVSQVGVVCIMYDIPFPMSQYAHIPRIPHMPLQWVSAPPYHACRCSESPPTCLACHSDESPTVPTIKTVNSIAQHRSASVCNRS